MLKENSRLYFKGLNGIRFFAALMVIVTHIEGFRNKLGLPNYNKFTAFLGKQGVNIFFVLSGFLITYLILEELKKTKFLDIKKFYIRRVLRIWPLYFLILILGYFVFPNSFYPTYFPNPTESYLTEKLLLNVFFLPNLVLYCFGSYFATGVLWSVGVEEQFYLIWPWFYKKIHSYSSIIKAIIFLIVLKIFILVIWEFAGNFYFLKVISKLMSHDVILIGCLFGSYLHSTKSRKIIYSKVTIVLSIIFIIMLLAVKLLLRFDDMGVLNSFFGLCYGVIIVNISTNPNFSIKLEHPVLNYLGRISYGIYMYHSIFIALGIFLFKKILLEGDFVGSLILYLFTVISTLIVSTLSYNYFEKPFIRFKEKFMIVKSTNRA